MNAGGRGRGLITHLHEVPRLRLNGAIPPLLTAFYLIKHKDFTITVVCRPNINLVNGERIDT
jgi:hypothetical protein